MANDSLEITLEIDDSGANAKLSGFEQKLKNTDKAINGTGKGSTFGNAIGSQFAVAEAKANLFRAQLLSVGTSFGIAFGSAAVIGGAIKFLNDARLAANEAERANQKLTASATEAGLAYGILAEKNREFSRDASLSDTAGANVLAKITQLAAFSGKINELDKLSTSFLDLGAAKGIKAADLDTLIGTILSGQDEGLNKLGLADPSKLYENYKKEIGATSRELSQMEKVQAAVNAVMEKAAVFTGANEERLKSISGQTETASAQIENLYANFGEGLTGSKEFRDSLSLINGALEAVIGNIPKLREELSKGIKTPEQLAAEQSGGAFNAFKDGISDFGSLFGTIGGAAIDKLSGEDYETIQKRAQESFLTAGKRRFEFHLEQIQNEKKLLDRQKENAGEQTKLAQTKTIAESVLGQIEGAAKGGEGGVAKVKTTYEQIEKLQKEFYSNFNQFNDSQREKAQKGIDDLRSVFFVQKTDEELKKFSRNPNFADAKFDLQALETIKQYLPEEKYLDALEKFSSFIEKDLEKANQKIKEIEKNSLAIFDGLYEKSNSNNPFVSLFNEADKSLKNLRENTRGMSQDLISQFEAMDQKISSLKLFESRIDNSLDAFSLRDSANGFRNAGRSEADKKRFEEIARRGAAEYGLDFGSLNDAQKREQYERRLIASSSNNPNLIGALASDRLRGSDQNQSLNDRLNEQLKIIQSGASSPEQQAIADKRFISLTSGLDPNSLSSDLREKAALAREREAIRKETLEKDAIEQRKAQIGYQKRIAESSEKLLSVAEKEGLKGLEVLIKNETSSDVKVTDRASTPKDTEDLYGQYQNALNQ